MSMRWLAISCVSAIAACSEPPGPRPDPAPDGAPAEPTGLTLAFRADAQLPALLGSDVRVEEIYLNGSVIRAVGDATTEGEQSTTGHDHELLWDADHAPRDLAFSAAPVGSYAYVELRIAGRPYAARTEAFEILGEVRVDGSWHDFAIRADDPVVTAHVPYDMRLEAGRPLTIPLELAVSRLVEAIDWAALPRQDGELVLDEDSPAALAGFCAALGGAFRAR